MRAYNLALLAKLAVRIHERKHSLISQVLLSKYKFPPVTQGVKGKKIIGASWRYQGMCKAVYECRKGFSKVIGNAASTRIIEGRWVEGKPLKLKQGISLDSLNLINVKDLMKTETDNWNTSLV